QGLRSRDRGDAEAGAGRLDVVRLYVNVDHVATLRQQRGTRYPDPVAAATLCELAGADGITVHLREDRRHIQDRDVRILRETLRGPEVARQLQRLELAARAAADAGVHLGAGHGLDYSNVGPVAALAGLEELNIGHGLIARAVMIGMHAAVAELREAIAAGAGRG